MLHSTLLKINKGQTAERISHQPWEELAYNEWCVIYCISLVTLGSHIWSYLVTTGLTWSHSHGTWSTCHIWLHLFTTGHSWSLMVQPGHIGPGWSHWSHLVTPGHNCTHLVHRSFLITSVTSGHNWSHKVTLVTAGHIWSQLVTTGHILLDLVISFHT